jgi:hypothetical protein
MASVSIKRGTKQVIDNTSLKDGRLYFTTDQPINKIYTDIPDGQGGLERITIGGGTEVDSEFSTTSTNPVQNKVITNEVDDVRGQIHTNLLNPILQTTTINGVTYTANGDGSYTLNGTASAFTDARLSPWGTSQYSDCLALKPGKYKLTGTPERYSILNAHVGLVPNNGVERPTSYYDEGNGYILNHTDESIRYEYKISVNQGAVFNNVTFKPMLTTDLSATYNDYVPYSGDGRLNENVAALFDVIRPVGSLYPTTDANFNPNTAKGWHGTWERITDCVIYAAGTSDTIGQIVGSNTHTLTEAELPSHRHTIPALSGSTKSGEGNHYHTITTKRMELSWGTEGTVPATWTYKDSTVTWDTSNGDGEHTHTVTTNASNTGNTGSGTAIDMRPRRLNSVVWRRTA